MSKPHSGVIGLFPTLLQPAALRARYGWYVGGWSPFNTLPPTEESYWPRDLWEGNGEVGKHIANKRFTLAGCDISFSRSVGWYTREGSLTWLRALHSFGWMRDVLAYKSGKPSAKVLRGFIWEWMACSDRLHAVASEPDVMGERLANWMRHGGVLHSGARNTFRRRFLQSAVSQALALRRMLRQEEGGYGIHAIKGLLFVSLCLPGCGIFYKETLRELHRYLANINHTAIPDGRLNPMDLHETLRGLIEVYDVLRRHANREDTKVADAVAHLAGLLHHVCHADGGLILFHGSTEGDSAAIGQTLDAAHALAIEVPTARQRLDQKPTPVTLMDQSGFARMEAGRTTVVVDVSVPPDNHHMDTYFSTLAFEMSHGTQRVITNCGAFFGNDPTWGRVVKTTAAHSTLCVDDRNSYQLQGEEAVDTPFTCQRRVVDRDGYLFFEGKYDGYIRYCGLEHTRQLLINEEGTRFSGADHLQLTEDYHRDMRSHDVNLRFHLHPAMSAKRLMNGMVMLTSADGCQEWVFHSSVGQAVDLEESIYLGHTGKPLSTQQIVIYVPYVPGEDWAVEWSFIKS